jgi:hypothetical protein
MMSTSIGDGVVVVAEATGRAWLPRLEVLRISSILALNRVSPVVRQPRSRVRQSQNQSPVNAKGSCL